MARLLKGSHHHWEMGRPSNSPEKELSQVSIHRHTCEPGMFPLQTLLISSETNQSGKDIGNIANVSVAVRYFVVTTSLSPSLTLTGIDASNEPFFESSARSRMHVRITSNENPQLVEILPPLASPQHSGGMKMDSIRSPLLSKSDSTMPSALAVGRGDVVTIASESDGNADLSGSSAPPDIIAKTLRNERLFICHAPFKHRLHFLKFPVSSAGTRRSTTPDCPHLDL